MEGKPLKQKELKTKNKEIALVVKQFHEIPLTDEEKSNVEASVWTTLAGYVDRLKQIVPKEDYLYYLEEFQYLIFYFEHS